MQDIMNYLGAKSASGAYQAIINLMPPHDTYIEPFLGTGAVMKKKAAANRNIGVDINQSCIDAFNYAAAELYCEDAFSFLSEFCFQSSGRTLVYLDPPYLPSTRTSANRYDFELTESDHISLLTLIRTLPCHVIISGYWSELYSEHLKDWWCVDFQVMSRGGVRTEMLWCNFQPGDVHFHTYAGKDFTDRQRIKRKAERWANKFRKLPAAERQAVLAALLQVDSDL